MSGQRSPGRQTVGREPPEQRSTKRSNTTTLDSLRRRGSASSGVLQDEQAIGPFQEHYSCYEGLSWEELRGYLEEKWPGIKLVEQKVDNALEADSIPTESRVCIGVGSMGV
jgi:hypothetical protein